ncbi:hypothetical protein [Streptomyces sp. NPDC088725]|uniref:hypothetical protein n=1 Tax=Streptomyces sp. NPDC088725 TaxID=3365873 RepID=UPI0037FAD103
MADENELGEWEYNARADIVRKLVPGEVLTSVPAARKAAEEAGRAVQFDFLDDHAVLKMLRLRHLDEAKLFSTGMKVGFPLAILLAGFALYWGAYVRYWESSKDQTIYYAAGGCVVGAMFILFVVTAIRHWSNHGRQKVRARAREYRKIAHVARAAGAKIPKHYPHYGPYPFAANFHADAEEIDLPAETNLQ